MKIDPETEISKIIDVYKKSRQISGKISLQKKKGMVL